MPRHSQPVTSKFIFSFPLFPFFKILYYFLILLILFSTFLLHLLHFVTFCDIFLTFNTFFNNNTQSQKRICKNNRDNQYVHDRLRVSGHPQLTILHEHIIIIIAAAEGYQVILNWLWFMHNRWKYICKWKFNIRFFNLSTKYDFTFNKRYFNIL